MKIQGSVRQVIPEMNMMSYILATANDLKL